jgi:hypothetical protein
MKNKNYMIFSIVLEKACDKIQHSFIIKVLKILRIEKVSQFLEAVCYILIANILPNREKLKALPLKFRMRPRCHSYSNSA